MKFEVHRAPLRRCSPARDRPSHTPGQVFSTAPEVSAGFSRRIQYLAMPLVLRDPQQDSAENPKKIRTLDPELVLRDVPGKLVQRRGYPHRRRRRCRRLHQRRPLLQPPRHEVLRVALPPRRLRLSPTRSLALQRRADVLPIPYARVGQEPAAADPARALLQHAWSVAPGWGRATIGTTTPSTAPGQWAISRERGRLPRRGPARRGRCRHPLPRGWTILREQRRVNSRER